MRLVGHRNVEMSSLLWTPFWWGVQQDILELAIPCFYRLHSVWVRISALGCLL